MATLVDNQSSSPFSSLSLSSKQTTQNKGRLNFKLEDILGSNDGIKLSVKIPTEVLTRGIRVSLRDDVLTFQSKKGQEETEGKHWKRTFKVPRKTKMGDLKVSVQKDEILVTLPRVTMRAA